MFLPNTCTSAHNISIPPLPYLIIYYPEKDHAFAGIGAGIVAVFCMNPLDLLKVKFQVSTRALGSGIGRGIWLALRDIHASEGWRGLYRGLGPNVAGNASSWGLYFLLCVFFFSLHLNCFPFILTLLPVFPIDSYNQLKRRATL